MTTVPVQDLKQHLAEYLGRVEQGERIVVTRRSRPVAELRPLGESGLNVGSRCGTGRIETVGFRLPPGTFAAVLAEDRSDNR